MPWFQDLSPCPHYGPASANVLRSVGWLQRDHPFPTGPTAPQVYFALSALAISPWQPSPPTRSHYCDICLYEAEASGSANLFVPAPGLIYVCPELILHYMSAHAYCPPACFCEAVIACPEPHSPDYISSLLASGSRDLYGSTPPVMPAHLHYDDPVPTAYAAATPTAPLSGWNYRLVRLDDRYAVHEVYYDARDRPELYTARPVFPSGSTLAELRADCQRYVSAFNKPALLVGVDLPPPSADQSEPAD